MRHHVTTQVRDKDKCNWKHSVLLAGTGGYVCPNESPAKRGILNETAGSPGRNENSLNIADRVDMAKLLLSLRSSSLRALFRVISVLS